MEKILRIEETTFSAQNSWGGEYRYEGWEVITDKQTIKFGISDNHQCCEVTGYFITNDVTDEFIGSNILSVAIVDDVLNKEKAPDFYEGSVMFLNIETDKGTLQFTVYNEHNGYYSHEAVVISEQLNKYEDL